MHIHIQTTMRGSIRPKLAEPAQLWVLKDQGLCINTSMVRVREWRLATLDYFYSNRDSIYILLQVTYQFQLPSSPDVGCKFRVGHIHQPERILSRSSVLKQELSYRSRTDFPDTEPEWINDILYPSPSWAYASITMMSERKPQILTSPYIGKNSY